MIRNAGVGSKGLVGEGAQPARGRAPNDFVGDVHSGKPYPTSSRRKPRAAYEATNGNPPFQVRSREGQGAVVFPHPDRVTRLFNPRVRTSTAGLSHFSWRQWGGGVWLPPVETEWKGQQVASLRNRNVLRPSASTAFVPATFVPSPRGGRRA